MKYQRYRACRAKYLMSLLALSFGVSLSILAEPSDEEDVIPIEAPPENWYQAEVILFTQEGNLRNEAPPKAYRLEFPENWLQLSDPVDTNTANVLAEKLAAELFTEQDISSSSDFVAYSNQVPEASIPYLDESQNESTSLVDDATENTPKLINEDFIQEYEQPFLKLESSLRDLNESASGLDKRGYNVLFHQAWRFQSSAPENAPWIIIKAGVTDTNRYQIEGAVRFYQSRFIHFETNLWRLKFSDTQTKPLLLPDFPKAETTNPPNESIINDDHENDSTHVQTFIDDLTVGENGSAGSEVSSVDEPIQSVEFEVNNQHSLVDSFNSTSADTIAHAEIERDSGGTSGIPEYPVEEVWVMKKSQRVQEEEVYYLDHPEMGVLVTIKSYKPEPLNHTMEPELTIDTLSEFIGESSPL